MQYFLWIVVFILVNLFYFLVYLYINKRILHGEVSLLEDKIKHLEEMLEQADLMVNELNNVSDYVATRVERENNSLLKTMDELKEKMKEVEKLKAGLNDQVVQCGHLIEQYKETINNMNNKYAINVEENLSKRIPLHPKYNEVMRLAEKGNSIKDIARELHIGQGEVKLLLGIKK